jgi:hypothetical protein
MAKKQNEVTAEVTAETHESEQSEVTENLMTFAEVSKWNRENADKLPPPQESKMVRQARKVTQL